MTESEKPNSPEAPESLKRPESALGVRWWPLVVIVVGAAFTMITILALSDADRQKGIMICMLVVMAAFGLTLFWLILFSRLPKYPRIAGLIGIVAMLGAGFSLLEIKGTSGDLRPIIGWRFQSDDLAVPESTTPLDSATEIIVGAADFPQFFGPNRDGKLSGPPLALDCRRFGAARDADDRWRTGFHAGSHRHS